MRSGPTNCDFPACGAGALSGAGDEEVFETKASPPAVAGPLFAGSERAHMACFGGSRRRHDQ
jgi:hypothetical protein